MRLLPIALVVLCSFLVTRLSSLGLRSPIPEAPVYSISAALPPPLEPNERIRDNLLREFPGQVEAPEHFAFSKDGGIYFGVADGRIMRTRADALTGALAPLETVVQLGSRFGVDRAHPCGSEESEPVCGRALGMAFDAQGTLIVADCYLGLIAVDVSNKTRRVLLDEVDGTPLYFANSVVIGKSGTIYFTDSSSRWRRSNFLLEVMESAPTGRLIAFDPSTGAAQVLVKTVAFSNGLLVDPDEEQFLLMVELGRARILRVDLAKTRALPAAALPIDWAVEQARLASDASSSSAVTVLIDNLPGIPDNLSWEASEVEGVSNGGGGGRRFWVGCGTARKGPFSLTDSLAPHPLIRQALVWILPKSVFLKLVPRVGLLLRIQLQDDDKAAVAPNNKVVVAAATKATIVETLQDNSGRLALLTCAYEHQDWLYLGAISHEVDFVPRIPWTKENRTRADGAGTAQPTKL